MLDGLLKSKFYTKCKANLKLTKTRVESIKKKKIAVQKFLKNDIADLLKNGLDTNAYGRAEGLLIEQNMARCYELVENFCSNLSSNLSLMQKQRECPEECKEIVASLIYAAARFADLPELRELRSTLTERFGDSLQSFTNREFMERLSPIDYTKEMKLQLLQDIANEYSIEWDSKALEQMLFTLPTLQANNNNNNNKANYYDHNNKEQVYAKRPTPPENHASKEDDDIAIESETRLRGKLMAPPPPYLKPKRPEKSSVEENDDENWKPKPRSVRQRNQNINNNGNNNNIYLKPPPGRAASMPPEPALCQPERGPTRVASLPGDYDELAARIAALRGK